MKDPLTPMIREIAVQQHGISVEQDVYSGTIESKFNDRAIYDTSVGSGLFYDALGLYENEAAVRKYYIRQMRSTTTLSNGNNFPVRMYRMDFVFTRQCADKDLVAFIGSHGVTQRVPYLDPGCGNTFKRFCHRTRTRIQWIQPGEQLDVVCEEFCNPCRVIDNSVEASVVYPFPRGSRCMVLYFDAPPAKSKGNPVPQFAPVKLNFLETIMCSYYKVDDSAPITNTYDARIKIDPTGLNIYTDVRKQVEATDV